MKKLFVSFLLLLTLALCLPLSLPVSASPASDQNRTGAVTWKLDGDTLTGDDTAYTRYLLPPGYRVAQNSCYVYGNKIRASDGGLYSVRRPLDSTDFVWLSWQSGDVAAVFATPDGTAALKRFLSDGQGSYALYPETGTRTPTIAPVTADWLNALPDAGEHRTVDVRTLLDMPMCAIRFSDATGCVYTGPAGCTPARRVTCMWTTERWEISTLMPTGTFPTVPAMWTPSCSVEMPHWRCSRQSTAPPN